MDEHAILAALTDGTRSGCATDVVVTEPAEEIEDGDSPLLNEETKSFHLTMGPHVAWNGERTRGLQRIAKDNIHSFMGGMPKDVVT